MKAETIDAQIEAFRFALTLCDDRDEVDDLITGVNRFRSGLEMVIREANDVRQRLPKASAK